MRELATLVIPVYGLPWTNLQWKLFRQLLKTLPDFSVTFVTGPDTDVEMHQELVRKESTVYRFDAVYFQDADGLRRLLLKDDFYEMFGWSEFILLASPDTLVLKNELTYWCKQGHDYVGTDASMFSLRRVDTFQKMAQKHKRTLLDLVKTPVDASYDRAFWYKKGKGFWPALRMPSDVVEKYFAKSVATWNQEEAKSKWPFASTGWEANNAQLEAQFDSLNL